MRWIIAIPMLLATALLSVTTPALAGPFEFPFLQSPAVGAPAGFTIPVPSTVINAPAPAPTILDDRGVR